MRAIAGAALLIVYTISSAAAEPREAVERGDRMDRDAMRDDVRVDRLKVPQHPVVVEEPQQPAPIVRSKSRSKKNADNSH